MLIQVYRNCSSCVKLKVILIKRLLELNFVYVKMVRLFDDDQNLVLNRIYFMHAAVSGAGSDLTIIIIIIIYVT